MYQGPIRIYKRLVGIIAQYPMQQQHDPACGGAVLYIHAKPFAACNFPKDQTSFVGRPASFN